MNYRKTLFVEKYRPQSLDDVILPDRIRKVLENGPSMHFIFTGHYGVGKTTVARIMMQGRDSAYWNISDDSRVEILRGPITDYCMSAPLDSSNLHKIAVLDEIDGASDQFQKALRAFMESFQGSTRFIATCNYLHKLEGALQSRFEVIDFSPQDESEKKSMSVAAYKKVEEICKKEDIQSERPAIKKLVDQNFPDMRSVIKKLEVIKLSNLTLNLDNVNRTAYEHLSLFEMLTSGPNPKKVYQALTGEYANQMDDILMGLMKDFPKWLFENHPKKAEVKLGKIVSILANYQFRDKFIIDKTVNVMACMNEIANELQG